MCLTTPRQVEKITDEGRAILSDGRLVTIGHLPEVQGGDWILVNADFAVAKVSAQEAQEILQFLK